MRSLAFRIGRSARYLRPTRPPTLPHPAAIGVDFEIDDNKGPLLPKTIRDEEALKMLHKIDLSKTHFVVSPAANGLTTALQPDPRLP